MVMRLDNFRCISGDQSSLIMQEIPFQRHLFFKISRGRAPDPLKSSRPDLSHECEIGCYGPENALNETIKTQIKAFLCYS